MINICFWVNCFQNGKNPIGRKNHKRMLYFYFYFFIFFKRKIWPNNFMDDYHFNYIKKLKNEIKKW